ncbi:MAG: deoxyguanosinetriphosphate triphosphohydrolase-like protein [Chloroflexota bacterium]|nr:MAG: deoxyguanosinetriphosphate triphosphohydrolase-like protein [Chloroflexota bacterium]
MHVNRQQLERIEETTLAPYALLSLTTQGRRHYDPEPAYRTAFQRDRDRIIHAAAFRRLEYKTQVFVNDEGDYYRTRLTHTLEVAQIGRTLARALAVNEDLVEAICLAHDLGHPPFGHAGESALNALTADCGGFNHNHQSFRIVTQLERRYADWPGLNLTHETLEGIAKHETEYDLSAAGGFNQTLRGSVEAQIANVADELAYNAHDLDDGLQAELIEPGQLAQLEIWRELCDQIGWSGERMDELTRHLIIRELIGLEVTDVLEATAQRLAELKPQSPAAVQMHAQDLVAHSARVTAMNRALKAFLYENMYRHFRVMRMARRAEQFISSVFKSYIEEPRQLPREYQARLSTSSLHRVVADYIASMTDRSALLEYRRLFDPLMRP